MKGVVIIIGKLGRMSNNRDEGRGYCNWEV